MKMKAKPVVVYCFFPPIIQVKAPVMVAGCKFDMRDENQTVSLESLTMDIMQKFPEVVTCIECSAAMQYQVCCFHAYLY